MTFAAPSPSASGASSVVAGGSYVRFPHDLYLQVRKQTMNSLIEQTAKIRVGDRVRYHGYIGTVSSVFVVPNIGEKFGIRFDGDDDETLWFDAYNDADAITKP